MSLYPSPSPSFQPLPVLCYFDNLREMIGTISAEMLKHVLESFAAAAKINLHVHNIHGENNHHKVESCFKALGVAMRQALSFDEPMSKKIPAASMPKRSVRKSDIDLTPLGNVI